MKRQQALDLMRFAGYHNDTATHTRLLIENRVSYAKAKEAFSQGRDARARGVACGCHECKGAVS